jgi:murein DD-endopeptidase MepM/ murein hydrolase activator NlpD
MHTRSIAILLLSFLYSRTTFSQLDNSTIRDLKGGRVIYDTSYIYWLPYEPGKKFFLIQGWQSQYSHKGELSLDFKMKSGNKVYAAREGIVSAVKKDSDRGGAKDEYLGDGNHVVILHSDGSYAGYWHLQKDGDFVNVGDTVNKGQLIGLSGNTGYSAFPHLHFWVYKSDSGAKKTIPTRFQLRNGIHYLRPGQFYKSIHDQ